MILPQEILEHVLQFVDGETLLMCREVSPEFAAAVKYLTKNSNIWEKCYSKEKGEKYPYDVIAKLHPHFEGLSHPKNWGVLYETCKLGSFLPGKDPPHLSELNIGKHYSDILDVETHEDLLLVLVKYNKDFSIFYRILTINLKNNLVDKSCRFYADRLYVTPIEHPSNVTGVIKLSCDKCHLVAVPLSTPDTIVGYPKFSRCGDFLTVDHSNGEFLWLNGFEKLLTKGSCFHVGRKVKYKEIKQKSFKMIKVSQCFTHTFISCGDTSREFDTFQDFQACVTTSYCYSNLLFLGTDTGMLYVYNLGDESDLKMLNLQNYIWRFNVCSCPILVITAMELKNKFVIVCSSEKSLYRIYVKREFKNLC